jgi:nucleoside-diphosphate-sugar epimerase
MRTVVLGASGFIGRNIIPMLVQGRVRTLSVVRSRKSADLLKDFETEVEILDSMNKENFIGIFEDVDVVINLIGISSQSANSTFEKVNWQLVKEIVEACKEAGVRKIVTNSGLGVRENNFESYFYSKWLGEQEISNSGLSYTIFRPSYIIGKNDEFTPKLISDIRKGSLTVYGSGDYLMQPIYVGDVAKIFFKSVVERMKTKEIFDLVGPKVVSLNQYADMVSKQMLKKKLIKKMPKKKYVVLEKGIQGALNEGVTSVEEFVVRVSNEISRGAEKILEKEFGFKLTSLEETVEKLV